MTDLRAQAESGRIGQRFDHAAGKVLWREGDAADHVLVLLRGQLEVTHEEPDGETVVLRVLDSGSIVGEIATLDGGRRSAGIRTRTQCSVVRIDTAEFREVLRENPGLFERLFWEQVDRVRALTREVTTSHHQAITDGLTKLYNIGFFRKRLEQELERAAVTGDAVSIAMFDVDHFKHLNDTQGHQTGDQILSGIASILRSAGRRGDIVARYGGEEFIVLLYGATTDEATLLADDVRLQIAKHPFPHADKQPGGAVTVSGGVATFPRDGNTPRVLIEAADSNLYAAKRGGRNRVIPPPPGREHN